MVSQCTGTRGAFFTETSKCYDCPCLKTSSPLRPVSMHRRRDGQELAEGHQKSPGEGS